MSTTTKRELVRRSTWRGHRRRLGRGRPRGADLVEEYMLVGLLEEEAI
jgi:hypothetical protein